MREKVHLITRERASSVSEKAKLLNIYEAKKVQEYHKGFPYYNETPLVPLNDLAKELGVAGIYVKDESQRFGLNAFKALGASYAIGRYLADRLGFKTVNYNEISSPEAKRKLGDLTFATTTDGNHGRGVAFTATTLGFRSVVYMPQGSAEERVDNIRKAGADVTVLPMNYDNAVRYTAQMAKKNDWIIMQDTSWEGYEEIPTWIMQGYMTMAYEAYRQLKESNVERPTHIFLQPGVGSMPAAVLGFFVNAYEKEYPKTIIVEPEKADCFFRTAKANDGMIHAVTGVMDTIMAGLACGEPNPIAWNIIGNHADAFASCTDSITAKGMRILGNPIGNDRRIISGESGAVGLGLTAALLNDPELAELKDRIGLDKNSVVLCFSTEGDTYRAGYRSVVWDGAYPYE
ncbi:MAG: diaminopropionate ammonia-lyase [Eubacteriales bacterium]|nr:diaminopropionate ammonia-lyase [Eubacteriales bacterium]